MYNNISKSLLAVASLAMVGAATTVNVTEADLRNMNENDKKFVMSSTETLTIHMSYALGSQPWTINAMMGAPFTVSNDYAMCTMKSCTYSWDINYTSTNDYHNSSAINSYIHFVDTDNAEVPVGLKIKKPVQLLGNVGELTTCTPKEALDVKYEGIDMLDNIEPDLVLC